MVPEQQPAVDDEETGANGEEPPQGHLYIIDVSQSVEQDHPHAFDFLRSDLRNVEDFFSKRGVRCLGLRRAFDFVTRDSFESEGGDAAALENRLEQDEELDATEKDDADSVADSSRNGRTQADEDAVFMKSYIPRTLNEVYDPERDVGKLNQGDGEKLIYEDTIGIVAPTESRVRFEDEEEDEQSDGLREESGESDGEESEDGSEEGEDGKVKERKPRGHRHEDKDAKKVRYLAVALGMAHRDADTPCRIGAQKAGES